jgi:hypothetical protein
MTILLRRTCKHSPLLLLLLSFSCKPEEPDFKKELDSLKTTAAVIQHDLTRISKATQELAEYSEKIYQGRDKRTFLPDSVKLTLNDNGILYKAVNDSGSSIYVSGYSTVDQDLMQIVSMTGPLDAPLMKIVKQFDPLVVQSYFIERHSYIRLYPYIDVLSQFEPKLNFENLNFYFLADAEHDPDKKVVLISDPYVDPAGRGWVISFIAPVYSKTGLEGVVGVNITVDAMKKKYLSEGSKDIMLLDSAGIAIMIDEKRSGLFDITPVKSHNYMGTIKRDEYLSEDYNLLKSKNKEIRNAFTELIRNKKDHTTIMIDDDKYYMVSYKIPELDWFLIKLIKEN